jgi:hypothetical protein
MTEHISFVISYCLKHYTAVVHLFQSKLCTSLSGKWKDLTKLYYFLMVLPHGIKTGKISSTCAIMKMVLV